MSGLAALYYNWRHSVMFMRVLSSARAASLSVRLDASLANHPLSTLVLLVPSHWPENNKHQPHHPSYLLGSPPATETDTARPRDRKICIKLVNRLCSVCSQPALQYIFRPTAASALKQLATLSNNQFVSIEPRFRKKIRTLQL